MLHLPLIQAIKLTLSAKVGACLVIAAPIMLAIEVKDHIDSLITAVTTILIFIGGVFFLKKGQDKIFVSMDGRMTELLETTRKIAHAAGKDEAQVEILDVSKQAARAEGIQQGQTEERVRQENKSVPVKPNMK